MGNTALTYDTATPAPVLTDEAMFSLLQAALVALTTGGQSVSVVGAYTYTLANLPELRKLYVEYELRVLALRGFAPVTHPDFSAPGGM